MTLVERGQHLDEAVGLWFSRRSLATRRAAVSLLALSFVAFVVLMFVFGGRRAGLYVAGSFVGVFVGGTIRTRRARQDKAMVDVPRRT